jgi:hypothetical protein
MTITLSRPLFLTILRASLAGNEYRFARQSALQWLAVYPGDHQVSQAYAQALIGENCLAEARTVLKGLCQSDPEDLEAVQCWLALEMGDFGRFQIEQTAPVDLPGNRKSRPPTPPPADLLFVLNNWYVALRDETQPVQKSGPTWGESLQLVRKGLEAGDINTAAQNFPNLIIQEPNSPLMAVTHLRMLQADPNVPLPARRSLAEFYHRRWPDCLACTLLLATWLLQEGTTERAVALLHKVAARDVSGQVAQRILGPDHPYRSLWPGEISLSMDLIIPAEVARILGWNQLPAGEPVPIQPEIQTDPGESLPEPTQTGDAKSDDITWAYTSAVFAGLESAETPQEKSTQPHLTEEEIVKFSSDLDRLATDLDQFPASAYDGRFPVYVIFSVHGNLEAQYGAQGAAEVVAEMKRLANAISSRKAGSPSERWDSIVYLPDNPENIAKLMLSKGNGANATQPVDPWSLKLSLADLDKALGKKGEMIGALLIVGGPEIVPFHNLPNPVDDPDSEIPSDNPYSTRDENYFIPEWPVGRIPCGAGNDPTMLLLSLRQMHSRHSSQLKSIPRPKRWLTWILGWIMPNGKPIRKGFGITAAVWRQASFQVFRPVAEAKAVMISPPISVNGNSGNGHKPGVLPSARLGYFNLHGLANAAEWYGQRDPLETSDGPDYPVALRPDDVRSMADKNPLVVFSEACYGAHILNKTVDQALALQFLKTGTQVVAGSTTMSYGAINKPLIGADLLGYKFWKALLEGLTAGEALQRAKIELAGEMHQRQGYLDGEDQKTLISFVLYGDPLLYLTDDLRNAKHRKVTFRRLSERPLQVKTVCDRILETEHPETLPPEVITSIKQFVANYLPGMSDAHATYTAERAVCIAHGHNCPTGQLNRGGSSKNSPYRSPNHHMIVLSKTLENAGQAHPQFARLTLNSEGKLVKIVVSR